MTPCEQDALRPFTALTERGETLVWFLGDESGLSRAQDLFTDREDESRLFLDFVLDHEESERTAERGGRSHHRDNVLVFHGVGGVGKTSLSVALQSWIEGSVEPDGWGSAPDIDRPFRCVRVDLQDSEGFDAERLMLFIRSELADAGMRLDAFDLAVNVYWRLAHPGSAFPAIKNKRINRHVGDQIDESLTEVLQQELNLEAFGSAGAVIRALKLGHGVVSKKLARSRAEACPDLAPALRNLGDSSELSRDDAVILAPLLSWDLDQTAVSGRPQLVVFIDTYERAQLPTSNVDQLVRALAYFLPQALYVITGRNALPWANAALLNRRQRIGPEYWPGLHSGERQHLVGMLSEADSYAFLEGVQDPAGDPLIPAAVQRRIVVASQGLPLFLDLAVDTVSHLAAMGEPIDVDSFAAAYDQVVTRVVQDLGPDDLLLLRMGCLVPNWDVDLLSRATGIPRGRIVRSFLRRAFVRSSQSSVLPYYVHPIIREAMVSQSASESDWLESDWRDAAASALSAIKYRLESATEAVDQAGLITTALRVAGYVADDIDWLRLAVSRYRSLAELASAIAGVDEPPPSESYGGQLVSYLRCHTLPPDERPQALLQLATSGALGPTLEVHAWRSYAYRLRGLGRREEALDVFRRLIQQSQISKDLHRLQLALTLCSLGRFSEALTVAEDVSEARQLAVEASLARWHGRVGDAADAYKARAEYLAGRGDDRVSLENLRNEAFFRCLIDPSAIALADVQLDRSMEMNYMAGVWNMVLARMAARAGVPAEFDALSADEAGLDTNTNSLAARREFVLAFHAAVMGDGPEIGAALTRLRAIEGLGLVPYERIMQFWSDWLTGERTTPRVLIDWIEAEDSVRERWINVPLKRRQLLSVGPGRNH